MLATISNVLIVQFEGGVCSEILRDRLDLRINMSECLLHKIRVRAEQYAAIGTQSLACLIDQDCNLGDGLTKVMPIVSMAEFNPLG